MWESWRPLGRGAESYLPKQVLFFDDSVVIDNEINCHIHPFAGFVLIISFKIYLRTERTFFSDICVHQTH